MPAPVKTPEQAAPPALTLAAWEGIPGLVHGFYGRAGGYSSGAKGSLNLSDRVGDDPATVERNWRLLTGSLRDIRLVRMSQVHGDRVLALEHSDWPGNPAHAGECDGLLTKVAGLAPTVMTADCVPILLVAPQSRAVMALHAGWRGSLAGIAAAGLDLAKRKLGIRELEWQAAIGPSIGGCCYEVSAEIGESFTNRWGRDPDAWQPHGDHGQLDLRRINARILADQGLAENSIHAVGPCTACDYLDYFSHRRSGGRAGRQVSVIGFNS